MAEKLNSALSSGRAVYVSTCTKITKYTRAHAGAFFMSSGDLYVRHGKKSLCLSMGDILLVKIQIV